jgi:hypothetical protein
VIPYEVVFGEGLGGEAGREKAFRPLGWRILEQRQGITK